MAEVVEAHLAQASGLEEAVKHAVTQVVRMQQAPGLATEDPQGDLFPHIWDLRDPHLLHYLRLERSSLELASPITYYPLRS